LIVERTDFITVPVTDVERSTRFYAQTLGLPWINEGSKQWPELQLGENVSLYLMDPRQTGAEFQGPHTAHIALRVPDVAETRQELEGRGVTFDADTLDTGVCHMAFFKDPDGNQLMLHRRYAPHEQG
jgi:catechol 2,3-dioxygenase-like lactoylglutathione lyase family enzyme